MWGVKIVEINTCSRAAVGYAVGGTFENEHFKVARFFERICTGTTTTDDTPLFFVPDRGILRSSKT